ncbi:MAG: OmpA family protein [Deltaproteobacteria bacterium]|nr:OmpA family protein [Deltaproteobacteria bacterium]MCW5805117.1 OmpA family protein [Deltaproteobacteria bacterium]
MRGLLLSALLATAASGCSLFTTKEQPFPPLDITARRPPPGPDRVVLLPSNIVISDKVQFQTNSADLLEVSFKLLDEVVTVMSANPQIEEVRVEGHTDSTGDAAYNKTLSQKRAESVMKYLVGKGIAKGRLTAEGFGADKPIADNAEPAGQDMNRRVEFFIVKQGPIKKIVKDQ